MDMAAKIKVARDIEARFHASRVLSVKGKRGGAVALVAVNGSTQFFLYDTRTGTASGDTLDRVEADRLFKCA